MCLNSSILHMDPGTVDFSSDRVFTGVIFSLTRRLSAADSQNRALEGESEQLNWAPAPRPSPEELLSLRSPYWGPRREEPHQAESSLCQYIPVSKQHTVIPISEFAASRDYFHCILLAGSMGLLLSSASRNSHISSVLCYGRTPETGAPALISWQHMHIGRLLSH